MLGQFSTLFREHEDALIRTWVDRIYADHRTELPSLLSYRQLIDHIPELFDELAQTLDHAASDKDIGEAVRHLRFHAQVRFQQGCLIDEVARELIILREVLNDFLWREGLSVTEGDIWELRDTLRRTNTFVDEMIAQTIVVYAASLRPPIRTRALRWPLFRRRWTDSPQRHQ